MWANTGNRNYVAAVTDTHIVISDNTDSHRQSRAIIAEWEQTPALQWNNVRYTLPVAQIRQLRSASRGRSRLTVYTDDTVLTMRGFQWRQRGKATSAIAEAAGLVQRTMAGQADCYTRPGELPERFDGDNATTDKGPVDTLVSDAGATTVRSLFWAMHALASFFVAGRWVRYAAIESLGQGETALLGLASAFAVLVGIRFLVMRLSFDEDGITIVNFWRRHDIAWTEFRGTTTAETWGTRWRRPVVTFESAGHRSSSVTTCWSKARAQQIAAQVATQVDSRTRPRSAVFADDLMLAGKPTSATRQCLHAGSFFTGHEIQSSDSNNNVDS